MKHSTIGKQGRLYKRKHPLPEVGERFGLWTVKAVSNKTYQYKKIFVCQCDCGAIKEVKETSLCRGISKSCGCVSNKRKHPLPEIGERYGLWTVKAVSNKNYKNTNIFVCQCDCGAIKELKEKYLCYGISKSCGCARKRKPGEKFGRLTLVEQKRNLWLVRCDCGKEKLLRVGHLTSGNTKSCGCLNDELMKQKSDPKSLIWQGYKEIPKSLWSRIQRNAKSRGIEFDINIEYAWKLFLEQKRKCSLSGCILKFSLKRRFKNTTASLDRIDSKKGYVKGNVQWVHKKIQKMKFVFPQSYFLDLCKSVADYSEQK